MFSIGHDTRDLFISLGHLSHQLTCCTHQRKLKRWLLLPDWEKSTSPFPLGLWGVKDIKCKLRICCDWMTMKLCPAVHYFCARHCVHQKHFSSDICSLSPDIAWCPEMLENWRHHTISFLQQKNFLSLTYRLLLLIAHSFIRGYVINSKYSLYSYLA